MTNLKNPDQKRFIRNQRNILVRSAALLFGLFAAARVNAQNVISSPPATSETPPALEPFVNTEMDVFSPAGSTVQEQLAQPFRYEFLTLRPHVDYSAIYANGILAAPGQPVNTVIQQISPGLRLDVGDHWILDYTPTWMVYSSKSFQNTLNHAAKLSWGTSAGNWVLGLTQTYTKTAMPQVQTGTQTHQEDYTTALKATYTLNSKMALDLALDQNIFVADQFQSYREWSTLDWLNYQFWPRLSMALGVGIGYDNVKTGPDMLFEQYQGRIQWRATDKISFQINGGVEDRQFLSGGASDILNPLFGGGIEYQPFDHTKISLNADRTVAVSELQNNVTESVGFNANINQRLLGRLFLDLEGGYQNIKYVNSGNGAASNRTDDYYYLHTRLSTTFLKRGTIAIFYQLGDDSSTQSGFNFISHQGGIEIGFAY